MPELVLADRPQVVVLQHVVHEPLGTLEPVLEEACDLRMLPAHGDPVAYRHAVEDLIRTHRYDAVVALGGPCSVYEHATVECLDHSLALLRDTMRRDLPVLGICLGAQLLAWTLGAQVWPGRTRGLRREIGWFPVHLTERGRVDPALRGFDDQEPVFQWHGDTFDMPAGAWHLASSTAYRSQAFRWGRWAYGLQFHVEVTPELVARWVTAYSDELAELDYVDGAALVGEAGQHAAVLERRSRVLGEHFVACIEASWAERRGGAPTPTGPPELPSPESPAEPPIGPPEPPTGPSEQAPPGPPEPPSPEAPAEP